MNPEFKIFILKVTGAEKFRELEVIQSLWSGYGKIIRIALQGATQKKAILKHISFPIKGTHPRGWDSNVSHERKVKSYEVEHSFYGYHASKQKDARIPHCWGTAVKGEETLLVLEDLDESGYPVRKTDVVWSEIACCLEWLANFHATNMQVPAKDLWETGTYWHLNTRPEELQVLKDVALKNAAPKLDAMLTNANYQTIVHGDAKLANFCFSETGDAVAAVDFQYAGGGVGIKDVAYFVGSCLREEDCERLEEKILATYFKALQNALQKKEAFLCFEDLEAEWRALYPIAWTDFYRFLKGWSPNHWKINSYSEKTAIGVLARI
jgi:hypothetical protein